MNTEKITLFVAIATLVVVYLIYKASKPGTAGAGITTGAAAGAPPAQD